MAALALLMTRDGFVPIIKNIWTSTFAQFSSGFTLMVLGTLIPIASLLAILVVGHRRRWILKL